jgi:phosphatidylserine/phosphatidylglycerophosphate/cardiolipin synthase-like enzyme
VKRLWLALFGVAALGVVALVLVILARADIEEPLPGPVWQVAFTSPPVRGPGGLDERLVALIDSAVRTVDVADYDFDLTSVSEALARAKGRGLRVRMVTDSDTLGNVDNAAVASAFGRLREAGITVVGDGRRGLMHHKFSVVDGEWVATGSWNYTDGDTYRLNNNLAIFHSRRLADNYTDEFETMFVRRRFGTLKPAGVPHPRVILGGTRIETYFATRDRLGRQVVDRLRQAQRSIHFLAFSFTHDEIGAAMRERKTGGLDVRGVFEATGSNTAASEYGSLRAAGLEVYQDANPYWMHHKVIVVDQRVTLFGSFNFSASADEENDENLLVVEDAGFAWEFEQEFQRVLAVARTR